MVIFDYPPTEILKELSQYHRDKKTILLDSVQQRLTLSLHTYYSEMKNSCNFLQYKEGLKVARNINKEI